MADLSLKYLLYGEDRSASKAIKGVGTQATSTAGSVGSAVGRLGQMVGGEVGDMLNRVSMGFDSIGEHTKGMAPKLIAGGSAIMGLGLAMQTMASKDIAAQKQLDAAVAATGKGYAAFGEDVEKVIQKQVAFGHTDDEVKTALRTLTTAYNDPKKALQEMGLVTDLAAAKNISLGDAAGLVAKAHGGAGKVFKQFGIQVGLNADGTKNYDGALTALSGKLAGQATASMDTFAGKVKQVKTWLEDQATALSEKYGPAVTVAGGLVTALGSVMQVMATRSAAAALAQKAETTAVEGSAVAMRGAAVASRALAVASGPVGLALVVLTTVAGAFMKSQADSKQREDDLRASLDQTTGAITDQTKQLVALQLQQDGTFKLAASLGISAKTVTDAALGQGNAYDVLKGKQSALNTVVLTATKTTGLQTDQFGRLTGATDVFSTAAEKTTGAAQNQAAGFGALLRAVTPINGIIKEQSTDQKELASATTGSVDPAKTLAAAQKDLKDKTKTATDAINSYHQALQDAGLAVLSTRDAQRNLIQSTVDATAAVKKNGETLNINTQRGRDNAAALDAVAGKAIDLSKSIYAETGSEDKMRASLTSSRASLVLTAEKFGLTKAQAEAYADKVLKIPDKKTTDVLLAGVAQAKADAAAIKLSVDNIPKNVAVNVRFTSIGLNQTLADVHNLGARSVPGNAEGTSFFSGGLSWVGERGPELVSLPRGTAIHSNADSMAMARGDARATSNSGRTILPGGGAEVVKAIKALGDRFGVELDRQARTIQTMQRQMAGAR